MQVEVNSKLGFHKDISFKGMADRSFKAVQYAAQNSLKIPDIFIPNFKRNKGCTLVTENLLKLYQFFELYPHNASKKLEKLLKNPNISSKQILLYLIGGGITFTALRNINSVDELDKSSKKELLGSMMQLAPNSVTVNNYIIPDLSDSLPFKVFPKKVENNILKDFPLLPKNETEYRKLLNDLAQSLEIQHAPLTTSELKEFNLSLQNLSKKLTQISDQEFANMNITQEYSKNSFIIDILNATKDLNQDEKDKLFSKYEFSIEYNPKNKAIPYSLEGYPKLQDTVIDPQINKLVDKFVNNNKIHCYIPEIEHDLNVIINNIPELRSTIGKEQHQAHDFDIFKHSLKVLKKINEDPNFEKLNSKDKTIMNLAALMHDMTKKEHQVDNFHTINSSIDSYFISKRFNLSNSEQKKLYRLIKNHEWIKFINTSYKDPCTVKRRTNKIAWEMKEGNLFEMLKIFTHADLKSVKKDDSFEDRKTIVSNNLFKTKTATFSESVELRGQNIENKIIELQNSQPLTPITRFPKASRIKEAITQINTDGSTNIKGVYVDKDGFIVLMFNEIDDWEIIGFPKGSTTKGINVQIDKNKTVETGNIKFLVHGLDSPTSLTKFNQMQLPDSNGLLSVSYAERPETKYRFFRPQGMIGYADTYDIIGGGTNDVGSGCKKTLSNFASFICYDPKTRERAYISNQIKQALNITDKEYRELLEENANKGYTEIYPEEKRNKIIKKLGLMKSETRRFAREYNEFYATKVKPMATFAYNIDTHNKITNPIEFLHRTDFSKKYKNLTYKYGNINSVQERTSYLRQFALDNDIPFVIFGN